MGTTTSRPILHSVESALLQMAQFIDTIVRSIEHLISSLFTFCLPSSLYHEFQLTEEKELRACDEQGMCYIPATRVKQHADWKHRREERLKKRKLRAEWAAAGLDVNEMEKQEAAKKKQQNQLKNAGNKAIINEKQTPEAVLGPVPRAPPLRPESERETQAEKDRGKLWIMGNIAPKKSNEPPAFVEVTAHQEKRMPNRLDRHAALESVREASHHEQREYAVHGHGGRIASGASEHGDISYQIVATSRDSVEDHRTPDLNTPKPKRHRRTITPQGIVPASTEAMVSATSASRIEHSLRPTPRVQAISLPSSSPTPAKSKVPTNIPILSQPTLVQPTAQRLRQSLDLFGNSNVEGLMQPITLSPTKKDPIDIRTESPRFFNRARASLDAANIGQLANSSPPTSPILPPFSSASSDGGSIASRKSMFGASISRSSTPPCVMDLADRACKSRWEASAKERKVWKGEVNRMTLEKLHQTSKRHHETQGRVVSIGPDLRLQPTMSVTSTTSNLAIVADKRLRRASIEPRKPSNPIKAAKRRSSQKP